MKNRFFIPFSCQFIAKSLPLQRFLHIIIYFGKMKKLLILAFLAVGMTANAGNLFSRDKSDDNDLVLKKGRNSDVTMHLGVGVNVVTGAPEGYEFAPFKSWDFQWTVVQYDYKPKRGSQTYSIGLGLNWRSYGLKDNNTAFEKVNDVVGLGGFPNNAGSRHSHVRTLGINIPLLFTQSLGKDCSFSLGPVVNFKVGGWVKNDWEVGDQTIDVSTSKIGQRTFTVDALGILDFDGFGIFCKYSPMSVFKNDRGPEFKSITFGLYF